MGGKWEDKNDKITALKLRNQDQKDSVTTLQSTMV